MRLNAITWDIGLCRLNKTTLPQRYDGVFIDGKKGFWPHWAGPVATMLNNKRLITPPERAMACAVSEMEILSIVATPMREDPGFFFPPMPYHDDANSDGRFHGQFDTFLETENMRPGVLGIFGMDYGIFEMWEGVTDDQCV